VTAEPAVIDYEAFCEIHDCHDRQGLAIAQTAQALRLDPRTVAASLTFRASAQPAEGQSALIPLNRASRGCWIPIRTVLSRCSSVCAKRDTTAA